jgi:hypothetical protein
LGSALLDDGVDDALGEVDEASCEISAPLLGAVKPGGTAPNSR